MMMDWNQYQKQVGGRLSELMKLSPDTVRGWIWGKQLPKKHALRLAQYLEQHASECEALARELRAYEKNRRPAKKRLTRIGQSPK